MEGANKSLKTVKEGKRLFGGTKHKSKDYIEMDVKETQCMSSDFNWVSLGYSGRGL
jgi:hypothetical protein